MSMEGKPFEPGREKTGGRVKGSRNKLTAKFVSALCEDFEKNGEEAIRIARTERPHEYLRVIAAILPKELDINDNRLKDIPDDELDALIELARKRVAGNAIRLNGGETAKAN
jgi:hypothetical protein